MRADQRARRDAFLSLIGTRPVVMGVLNVTPDSFSDGGLFQSPDAAVAQAGKMIGEGADIIDVGAESTRPGAVAVSEADELARLEPVVTALAERGTTLSIDTYKARVAAQRDQARRDPDQRRMGPAARSRDGRDRRRERSRGGHHAQPGGKGSRARHRRRHAALLRSFPRARRAGRKSRTRVSSSIPESVSQRRRNRTSKPCDGSASCATTGVRFWSACRARNSSGNGSGTARKASAPERSPPVLPPQRRAHHCSGCTTSPSMSRRCRCSTRSAAPAEITSAGNW